ncbi:MAG: aldehyde dehydrogenase [Proteobacteria bacterium]|nr:aldehyde dehydrogenase [Pseudomonadota bacterium]
MIIESQSNATALIRDVLPEACRDTALNWIGGEWRHSESKDSFITINPTTGRPLYDIAMAGEAEVEAAVAAGAEAQKHWWKSDGQDRARVLRHIGDAIRSHSALLGLLDTLDAGRPIRDTRSRDSERAARLFEFFAGMTDRLRGANIPVQPGRLNFTQLEPYGVVAGISPWNYPLTNAAGKIAPALATGNAIVLKPAEDSPLSALLLASIADEAGLPAGLLNVVNGLGNVTGEALIRNPQISKVSFTGSTDVGRHIGSVCGEALKSVTLELGGKSAFIVFDDADLDRAADALVFSAFGNGGQTCTAATRLFLSKKTTPTFLDAVMKRLSKLQIGDPLDPETHVGPLISDKQMKRVQGYIDTAIDDGAQAIDLKSIAVPEDGYFIKPVIFQNVRPDMRIAQEEVFGPLLSVFEFDDEDEVVELANATAYGLAGTAWTADVHRATRLARSLKAGLVWINTVHSLHPGSPYGGFKQSGQGLEMGQEAIQQLMKSKSIWIEEGPWQSPWGDLGE